MTMMVVLVLVLMLMLMLVVVETHDDDCLAAQPGQSALEETGLRKCPRCFQSPFFSSCRSTSVWKSPSP